MPVKFKIRGSLTGKRKSGRRAAPESRVQTRQELKDAFQNQPINYANPKSGGGGNYRGSGPVIPVMGGFGVKRGEQINVTGRGGDRIMWEDANSRVLPPFPKVQPRPIAPSSGTVGQLRNELDRNPRQSAVDSYHASIPVMPRMDVLAERGDYEGRAVRILEALSRSIAVDRRR